MVLNRGMTIDDAYRNEKSLSDRMYSMGSAYKVKHAPVPATRLFVKMVELYRTDSRKYFEILDKAKAMAAGEWNSGKQSELKTPNKGETAVMDKRNSKEQSKSEIRIELKSTAASAQNNRNAFLTWAALILSPQRFKGIEKNLSAIQKIAISSRLISGSMYEVTDVITLKRIRRDVCES